MNSEDIKVKKKELIEHILRQVRDIALKGNIPIIFPETSKFLTIIGKLVKPKKILEIGTAIGYSAILMTKFLTEGGHIETIERDYEMVDRARNNIKFSTADRYNYCCCWGC